MIQQQAIVSASALSARDSFPDINASAASPRCDVSWLENFLTAVSLEDISDTDLNVTYFVSGFIGRSISHRRRCSACKEILVQSGKQPELDVMKPEEHRQLFAIADRGGLAAPTEFCFAVTALSVQFYSAIAADISIKHKLFASKNQRYDFTIAIMNVMQAHSNFKNLVHQKCSAGHQNFEMIVKSTFNCFAINEMKRLNVSQDAPPTLSCNRKIRKLTSKGSDKNN